jgi:hypothetical protein
MLRAYETELDELGVTSVVVRRAQAVEVTSKTTAIDIRAVHIIKQLAVDADWNWQAIRDYVHDQICQIHGDFPPMPAVQESGIFKAFLKRWPNDDFPVVTGPQIARYAFEVEGGWWYGAPIGYGRFTKASDGYFAVPIATKLAAAAPFLSAL